MGIEQLRSGGGDHRPPDRSWLAGSLHLQIPFLHKHDLACRFLQITTEQRSHIQAGSQPCIFRISSENRNRSFYLVLFSVYRQRIMHKVIIAEDIPTLPVLITVPQSYAFLFQRIILLHTQILCPTNSLSFEHK